MSVPPGKAGAISGFGKDRAGRMSAPMLAATLAADSLMESRARWA